MRNITQKQEILLIILTKTIYQETVKRYFHFMKKYFGKIGIGNSASRRCPKLRQVSLKT